MSPNRRFALIFGIAYALVGVLGFIPGVTTNPGPGAPPLAVDAGYGNLLGLFPVNVVHNLIHLVVGVLGVVASGSWMAARRYAQVVSIVFVLLTAMGLIGGMNTTFGLAPIYGNDVWLHALTAILSGYFGFVARPTATEAGEHDRQAVRGTTSGIA